MTRIIRLLGILLLFSISLVCCKKNHVNQSPAANAGVSNEITLPTDTITLHGSGTDADGQVMAYLWSQVSGPGAASIGNATSQSVSLGGLLSGSYIFQLMVTDNQGATGVDTVTLKVNPAIIDTVTFQPSNNPTEMHIWGNSIGSEQSSNAAPEIGAASWTSGGNQVGMRGAFQFDLSHIPSNSIINSAKLMLYSDPTPLNGNQVDANYGTDNSMLIQQITQPWSTSTVTWINQPVATSTNQVVIPTTASSFLDLNIDVTTLVSGMINNNMNYGFSIRLQTETPYASRIFCSSKYSDATKHPKLVVIYTERH